MMAIFTGLQDSSDESLAPNSFPILLKLSPFDSPLRNWAQESCDLSGFQGDLVTSGYWVTPM